MKNASKPRSKSPSKRLWYKSGRSAAEREVMVAAPMSLSGYVQCVRRALRGRTEEYREFVDVIADLRRAVLADDEDDTATEPIISQIERAISLLDGQHELIAGLRMFLPAQYYIDVQPDAVVIKVVISNSRLLTIAD